MNIGIRIKQARTETGLSQLKLAAAVGITPRTLQWYESGDRQPPSSILHLIAGETGRSMDWFYDNGKEAK